MREWKLEDFSRLNEVINELNKGYYLGLHEDIGTEFEIKSEWVKPWKLSLTLEYNEEHKCYDLNLFDYNEELYYDGFDYDSVMERINRALRIDTQDNGAYFDCMCQGHYLADFEGRSEFTIENMASEMRAGIMVAIGKYMDDHDNVKPKWTDKKRNQLDKIEELIGEFAKELF